MKRDILVNVRLSVKEKKMLEQISKKENRSQSSILRSGISLIHLINQDERLTPDEFFEDVLWLEKVLYEFENSIDLTISKFGDMKKDFLKSAERMREISGTIQMEQLIQWDVIKQAKYEQLKKRREKKSKK